MSSGAQTYKKRILRYFIFRQRNSFQCLEKELKESETGRSVMKCLSNCNEDPSSDSSIELWMMRPQAD